MSNPPTLLDLVLEHETQRPNQVYLTQPLGQGRVADYTWAQVLDQSRRMAAHLQSLGLPRGARIAILSKNCAHFIMAELATWMGGYTTVAIFPTETAQTVGFVLEHSEASLLFVGKLDAWETQKPGVKPGLPRIAFPLAPESAMMEYDGWDEIVARTAPLTGRPQRDAEEMAMLIYTSGSTGTPKGVMTSFRAITAAGTGFAAFTRAQTNPTETGRVLSYLPLAHSFERSCIEAASLADGNMHVFFAEALETFLQDLQRARPTVFISVPRLWLKFQQGVFTKMPPQKLDRLLSLPIIGKIVGKKVLKGLGLDEVVFAGSGSAPLPPELIRWYRRLGLQLCEGYGMTEDNSYSHTSYGEFARAGLRRRAAERRRGASGRQRRGADQVARPVQRLLQAARADREPRSPRTASSAPATWVNACPTACSRSPAAPRSCSRRPRASTWRRRPSRTCCWPTRWSSWPWCPAWASPPPMRWWCWPKTCAGG